MFKFLSKKKNQQQSTASPLVTQSERFSIEDITDEDMMVAALVAAIDYQEENRGNVRVVSIKQLN